MPTPTLPRYISPADAADQLGIGVREVYRYVSSGKLPASRLSHKVIRIAETDLRAFVEARRIISMAL